MAGGPSGPRAGFWRRFGALLIDNLLIIIVAVLLYLVNEALGGLAYIAGGIFYFTFFEGSNSGQTIGKRALGIRVIDFNTGGPIGYGRAFIRYIGHILSGLVCYLGYLWMLWDKEKQTWHDKLATDVVVPVTSYPVSSWPN
jgi:uncharacterized RDD family membrane protein YckC